MLYYLKVRRGDFMDKCAVVTGASRGIGRAVAKKLSEDGYSLALIYKDNEAMANSLLEELECNAKIYKCDIACSYQVNNTVEKIFKDFSDISLLVNNAGIAQQKLFTDITDGDWQQMIDTNLSGAFYFTRAVLPYMIQKKSGKIINISSMWGETGGSCEVHYSAAKAGIIGMTKALAKEVGLSGITVNAVSPGVIMTDMLSAFSEQELDLIKQDIPLNRPGQPQDIANAVSFLASEKADYITGQVLGVNGGIVI